MGDHASPTSPRRSAIISDDPFLSAKITMPVLPDWVVSRERIETRIATGAGGPLTVITGPPGAGKTVAMASWAVSNACVGPTAWLTLDEYDNRPRVFWSYVVKALRHAGFSIPRAVWAAVRSGPADLAFILRLAAAIAAQDGAVSLVLDDLHLVTGHSQMTGLARLLRHAKPHLHVVVASRGDPGLPLHRYRLAGEVTEIRTDELAFTIPETRLLLTQHGVTLPPHALEYLSERAEGWAAALRLAAMSMKGNPDPEQSVKEMASGDGAIAGYLVEEVLNAQPSRVRDLLLKTSILDSVNSDLAREIAGDDHAVSELSALAEANAFVQPLRQGWYRYHSLFAEVLRLKLRREAPEEIPGLRHRAALWLQQHGRLTEAVQQAAEAGDWQLAARIVVDDLAIGELIQPGALDAATEVLRGLPHDQSWYEPQPWLVSAALGLSGARDEAPGTSLASAEELLGRLPPGEELPSRLAAALIRLALSRRTGDLESARTAAAGARDMLSKVPAPLLAQRPGIREQVLADQALVEFWSGDFTRASAAFRAAAAESGNPRYRADCLGRLALLEAVTGRLTSADVLTAQASALFQLDATTIHPQRSAMVARAYVHLQRHELPAARRCLKAADTALRACPDKLIGAIASLVAAGGCLAEGRSQEACDIVARARRGWSPPPWLEQKLALLESRAFTAAGDTDAALGAAERAGPETSLEAAAALARARLAAGNAQAARKGLSTAIPALPSSPANVQVEARLVEARLAILMGEHDRAVRSLEQAFRLARAERLRLPFVLERTWLGRTAERDATLARAYRDLLDPHPVQDGAAWPSAASEKRPSLEPAGGTAKDAPRVVDKLSAREREVLRHVSDLLDTAEIAAEMYVSVNTVKSHLKSIFRKLGTASRNEAVRRARQLDLI